MLNDHSKLQLSLHTFCTLCSAGVDEVLGDPDADAFALQFKAIRNRISAALDGLDTLDWTSQGLISSYATYIKSAHSKDTLSQVPGYADETWRSVFAADDIEDDFDGLVTQCYSVYGE